MAETSRYDAWQAGDRYEAYMGRWSRRLAPLFLSWLGAENGRDWLDIGCGTGALTTAILANGAPNSLISIDSSEQFVEATRSMITDRRVSFQVGDAQALSLETASRDVVVSAVVLNFVPDTLKALKEMKRVARPGGAVGLYVWGYPGRGVEFMQAFWEAAAALDPAARDLVEDKRFAFCTPDGLTTLMNRAGLTRVEYAPLEIPTVFVHFEDYWHPFTLGAGPAPGYCASLAPEAQQRLKEALHKILTRQADGSIALTARARAVKSVV